MNFIYALHVLDALQVLCHRLLDILAYGGLKLTMYEKPKTTELTVFFCALQYFKAAFLIVHVTCLTKFKLLFCFHILCIGYYSCALKWLDVDFCRGSFALYQVTVQP